MDSKLAVASGYLELGMLEAAWDTLDELRPEDKRHPGVLGMRVRIFLALGKTEEARVVAQGLARTVPSSAEAWLAIARVEAAAGSIELARQHLAVAIALNLDVRLEALEDESLEAVWTASAT